MCVCCVSAAFRGGAVQRVHNDIDAYGGRLQQAVVTRVAELHQQADNTVSERVTHLDEQVRELAICRSKLECACIDEEEGLRGTAQQLFCPAVARTAREEAVRVCVRIRFSRSRCLLDDGNGVQLAKLVSKTVVSPCESGHLSVHLPEDVVAAIAGAGAVEAVPAPAVVRGARRRVAVPPAPVAVAPLPVPVAVVEHPSLLRESSIDMSAGACECVCVCVCVCVYLCVC